MIFKAKIKKWGFEGRCHWHRHNVKNFSLFMQNFFDSLAYS